MDKIENQRSSQSDKELSEEELSQATGGGLLSFLKPAQKTMIGSIKQADGSFKEQKVTMSRDLYKQAKAETKANGGKPGPLYKAIFGAK